MAHYPDRGQYTGHLTSRLTSSASPMVLAYPNPGRKAFILYNDSPNPLLVNFSSSITSATVTFVLAANSRYDSGAVCHTGSVTGFWTAASGSAFFTDMG